MSKPLVLYEKKSEPNRLTDLKSWVLVKYENVYPLLRGKFEKNFKKEIGGTDSG